MARFFDIFSLYGMLCVMVPCAVFQVILINRRRDQSRMRGTCSGLHFVWVYIFLLYVWMVLDVTGMGTAADIIRYAGYGEAVIHAGVNLIPSVTVGIGYVLNIFMFVPFGFLLPLLWKNCRRWERTAAMGAGFSLLIELSQLFNIRAPDIDDLTANTIGTLLGFAVWKLLRGMTDNIVRSECLCRWEAEAYVLLAVGGTFLFYNPLLLLSVIE